MNSNIKTAIFWLVLICVAFLLWMIVTGGSGPRAGQDEAFRGVVMV